MKINSNLPSVEFEYPDSETNLLKVRYVRVLELNNDYVTGYELPHPNATVELGKFKKFRMARIARNGIVLRSFKAVTVPVAGAASPARVALP